MQKKPEYYTFVMLKPECLQDSRGVIGEIISIFEKKGFNISKMKMVDCVSEELINKHYEEHKYKPFFPNLKKQFVGENVIVMIVTGQDNIIEEVRKMIGATDPKKAEVGTIRQMYAKEMPYNYIHASDSLENAQKEFNIWFTECECTKIKFINNVLK